MHILYDTFNTIVICEIVDCHSLLFDILIDFNSESH